MSAAVARARDVDVALGRKLTWDATEAWVAFAHPVVVSRQKSAGIDRLVVCRYGDFEMHVLEHCAADGRFVAQVLAGSDRVADLQMRLLCD